MIRFSRLVQPIAFFLLWILIMASYAAGGTLSEEERHDLFSQAKEFFRQGNEAAIKNPVEARKLYEKAAMRFERIVREGGIRNGKLYYDIGNAYFLMGDLGRAILNYRRAERYIPGEPNLHQNLQYARSQRQDKIEEKQRAKVLKTLLFWHYDFSMQIRSVVFVLCFAFFWFGASVRLFSSRIIPRWPLACLGVIAILFLGSLIFESTVAESTRDGVILAEEVISRKGDDEAYQPSFKEALHAGTEFKLVENRNEWYHIELRDGRRTWIPRATASLLW